MKLPSSRVSIALIGKGLVAAYYTVAPWVFGITIWDIFELPKQLERLPIWLLWVIVIVILLSFQVPMWKEIFRKPRKRKTKEDKVIGKIEETPTAQG